MCLVTWKIIRKIAMQVLHAFSPSIGRQISEFHTSLIYIVRGRPAKATYGETLSQNKTSKNPSRLLDRLLTMMMPLTDKKQRPRSEFQNNVAQTLLTMRAYRTSEWKYLVCCKIPGFLYLCLRQTHQRFPVGSYVGSLEIMTEV